jgi:pimeloyl-ACP methyl ester carboxylesterase
MPNMEPTTAVLTVDDGTRLVCDVWAPRARRTGEGTAVIDGPPVVLHHGFAADAGLNWVRPGIVGALIDAGRWVVTVDARGHGRSDRPHDPARYGEGRMADDLRAVIDELGADEVDLAGYSMGAVVAARLASDDRRVRRLVLGGVGGGLTLRTDADARRPAGNAIASALEADDPSAIPNRLTAAFRSFAESTGADRLALAAAARAIDAAPITLDRITATTLVIVGRRDDLARRPDLLAAAIPGARLRITAGDHLGAVAEPAFVDALVEFLG